jgi:hypothetical protein
MESYKYFKDQDDELWKFDMKTLDATYFEYDDDTNKYSPQRVDEYHIHHQVSLEEYIDRYEFVEMTEEEFFLEIL